MQNLRIRMARDRSVFVGEGDTGTVDAPWPRVEGVPAERRN